MVLKIFLSALVFEAIVFRNDFDRLLGGFTDLEKERELVDCKEVLRLGKLFIRIFNQPDDNQASLKFFCKFERRCFLCFIYADELIMPVSSSLWLSNRSEP